MELLFVGDVHGRWDEADTAFVEAGSQRIVVFVGDLADEDASFVRRIATLTCEKVVILGNHDAWRAMRGGSGRGLRASLDLLGDDHLAWRARSLGGGVTLIGARPFSWGGEIGNHAWFYREHFGVNGIAGSADRIMKAVAGAPATDVLIGVAHNGPSGLGEGPDAIYGRDFRPPYEDFGDDDLRLALDRLRTAGRSVPLVVAGHMHDRLKGGSGVRRRTAIDGKTLHVNAAVVPRHRATNGGRESHYVRVVIEGGALLEAEDLWVDASGEVTDRCSLIPGGGADPLR